MIVAHDGSGDFKTIQEAINSISKDNITPVTILVKPGVYKEKLHLEVPYVTIKGEDAEKTILTYDDYALKIHEDGKKYGTFRSYTFFVGTHDVTLENLTIENSSGEGHIVGQALALYADGDRITVRNCRLLGHQDTLFTGPLPPAPIEPGSFVGPRENAKRITGRQYYESCYIEGDIDFIFGSATAYFYDCTIFSLNRNEEVNGYVTAASTAEGEAYGYVFDACKFTSNCPAKTVYLGRPWRNYAKTVIVNCEIGEHIKTEGWHDWNKPAFHTDGFYAEGNNTGAGSSLEDRASFSHQIEAKELAGYTRESVLSGSDSWKPW